MAVVLLLIVVTCSYLVVRVGALGLELTGVDRERGNFQALSAFTNSGYTTREAEEMVRHPIRRRIISFLMILGNAGMVTTMATFATSLIEGDILRTLAAFGGILLGLIVLLAVLRRLGVTRRVHDVARRWLGEHYDFGAPTTEDMLRVGLGYGVQRIKLSASSPVAGRYLRELDLKPRQVQVLAIERNGRFLPVPTGEDRVEGGDHLIVYGLEAAVNRVFSPDATLPLKVESGAG